MKKLARWTAIFLLGLAVGLGIRHALAGRTGNLDAVEALDQRLSTMLRLRAGGPRALVQHFETTLPDEVERVSGLGEGPAVRRLLAKVRQYYTVAGQAVPLRTAQLLEGLPGAEDSTPQGLELAVAGSTLSRVGEAIPFGALRSIGGQTYDLRGRVVVLDFFATWCPACLAAMPHLEQDIWQRWKDEGVLLIGVGREHTEGELKGWRPKTPISYPLAADPSREVFSWFASSVIPRCVLIGRDGRIKYQSAGFDPAEHAGLVRAVEREMRAKTN